jgi:hypothetical protein
MLLIHQQLPNSLSQRQRNIALLTLAKICAMPGYYQQMCNQLGVQPSQIQTHSTILNVSNNFSDKEAVQHLATIGVTDEEVRDAI